MENGHGGGKLEDKLSRLRLSDHENDSNNNNDSLFQVMKAVEAAEATIKQQVEENNRLRTELQSKIQLLEKYKLEETVAQRPHHADPWSSNQNLQRPHDSVPNPQHTTKSIPDAYPKPNFDLDSSSKINGTFKPPHADSTTPSHLSSPSTTSLSPTRHQIDGEFNLPAQGLMPMTELNNPTSLWKQDLVVKIREHEEEILQLRKHLTEYSIKEAQIRNEKYVLEKRIAYMRLAFDQQQQDLVDAASKALSYRQDIIEENIHLTYQLQAAQQERTTFVQSLLPLLAEYSLQPPVPDAQSIVSNVKVLFKHLQEKLILTESKLKESQYQLAPWRSDSNHSTVVPQSPSHSTGAALDTSNKNGLELVPQPTYPHGKLSTTSDAQVAASLEFLGQHQGGFGGVIGKNLDDDMRRYSALASRNPASQDIPAQFDVHATQYADETANKQVKFSMPVNNNEMDDPDAEEHQNERDHSSNWATGNPPYNTNLDDPNSAYSPYLPAVLEEPSSSFSEAADDDALPAIDGLQISGEAFPGRQLQACGHSINGTTSCNFEWVRHLADGSVNYIEGAKQPNYLVTADDVDSYLAIEVQPLDDRKRKGELVKVFANEGRKISCGPEMQNCIEKTLYSGHASYKVSLSTVYLDLWEPATLAIKREGYSIKCSGSSGEITEKFSPSTTVSIPDTSAEEFLIIRSGGDEHRLRADSADVSCSRDTIVLTLRLFIVKAVERRKGKKRSIFFHK